MLIKQYVLECLSHASYLLVDESSGLAVVVDPERDVSEYVADATQAGATIKHVVLTHFHGDFVTSHLAFRERFDAEIHFGARGQAAYASTPVHDGDRLELGDGGTPARVAGVAFRNGRTEVTIRVGDVELHLFADRPVARGDTVSLHLADDAVVGLDGS